MSRRTIEFDGKYHRCPYCTTPVDLPSPWIPCKDRLPEEGQACDILSDGERVTSIVFREGKFSDDIHPYYEWTDPVTHWQPLPAPPDKDEA